MMGKGAEAQSNPTPTEYVLLFVLAAGVCVAAFLLFDAVFSAFLLPKNGKRFVYFILNVLLYVLALPLGWLAVTMFVPALGL